MVPPSLRAQMAWDEGDPRSALAYLDAAPPRDDPDEVALRRALRDELELPAPEVATLRNGDEWSAARAAAAVAVTDAIELHGEFHRETVARRRDLAILWLQVRELEYAIRELLVARTVANRIFPARHPETAKVAFCQAIALAHSGRLNDAARQAEYAAEVAESTYPPRHTSYRALVRLRLEIMLRRGDGPTWNQYQGQAVPPDHEVRSWWFRPGLSLSFPPIER